MRRRHRRLRLLVLSCAVIPLLLSPPSAEASSAGLKLLPAAGPPTSTLTVKGRGFGASETVDVSFDSTIVATVISTPQGKFSTPITVPGSALPGGHPVSAKGEISGRTGQATFTVRTDWSRFGFDLANSGHNPYENVVGPSNVGKVTEAWATDLTFPPGNCIRPAVAGDVAYVTGLGGSVYAIDAVTGAIRWATNGLVQALSSPAIAGAVFVGGSGKLYSLDVSTGVTLWTYPTRFGVYSSPAVSGGVVYFGADGMFAIDATTGSLVWHTGVADDIDSSPAVANGLVYAGTFVKGKVYAFDAATGTPVWKVALNAGSISSSPVVSGGLLYIATNDGSLFALNALTGAQAWRVDGVGQILFATPALAGGILYLPTPNNRLYAFDAATGDTLWTAPTDGPLYSCPSVANGVVYVSSYVPSGGTLYGLDATTGTVLWQDQASASPSSPIIADGRVYEESTDNILHAFELP
jgi:outer membrane protein assembly factor BamB